MRDALRAELLKARSGFWLLAVLAYAVLLPLGVWRFSGIDLPDTQLMLACLAACPVAATFLGGYLVTRDYYYRSIERGVLLHRKAHLYLAKIIAGAVSGLVTGLVGALGWLLVTWLVLRSGLDTGWSTWQKLLGCLLACTLAGVFGVAIGWILRDYYFAAGISFLLPFAIELPLLFLQPSVARFLPNDVFAGLVQAPLPALFPVWLSLVIAVGWVALTACAGLRLFLRREVL
ncbi:hypothetical protein JNUCC0626_21075 [Lentzea sp. JNUCC 0626]|uniref:hypothetical protein n=1 Tax=Lentzea sp. JNUCC 0626 TaxID=3367513 RepID=UPI00374794D6